MDDKQETEFLVALIFKSTLFLSYILPNVKTKYFMRVKLKELRLISKWHSKNVIQTLMNRNLVFVNLKKVGHLGTLFPNYDDITSAIYRCKKSNDCYDKPLPRNVINLILDHTCFVKKNHELRTLTDLKSLVVGKKYFQVKYYCSGPANIDGVYTDGNEEKLDVWFPSYLESLKYVGEMYNISTRKDVVLVIKNYPTLLKKLSTNNLSLIKDIRLLKHVERLNVKIPVGNYSLTEYIDKYPASLKYCNPPRLCNRGLSCTKTVIVGLFQEGIKSVKGEAYQGDVSKFPSSLRHYSHDYYNPCPITKFHPGLKSVYLLFKTEDFHAKKVWPEWPSKIDRIKLECFPVARGTGYSVLKFPKKFRYLDVHLVSPSAFEFGCIDPSDLDVEVLKCSGENLSSLMCASFPNLKRVKCLIVKIVETSKHYVNYILRTSISWLFIDLLRRIQEHLPNHRITVDVLGKRIVADVDVKFSLCFRQNETEQHSRIDVYDEIRERFQNQ